MSTALADIARQHDFQAIPFLTFRRYRQGAALFAFKGMEGGMFCHRVTAEYEHEPTFGSRDPFPHMPRKNPSRVEKVLPGLAYVSTPGCQAENSLMRMVCTRHVDEVHFDGLVIHWHSANTGHGDANRAMWRNGPASHYGQSIR